MLKYMRENTGSWIIKILLGLIVVVFVFLGMGSLKSGRGNKVAVVNDVPITFDDYQRSYQNIMAQVRQRFGDNLTEEMIEMLQVKKQALDSLIEERLIADQAEKLEIDVSDKEIQASLLAVPAFKRNGQFDIETYKRILAANRWTPEVFEQMQKESLRQDKVRGLVQSSVTVSNTEAGEYYRFMNTAIAVDYLVVKADPAAKVDVTEEDLKAFYEANKGRYRSEPMVKARYIEFKPEDYKGKIVYTDDKLRAYYDANPDQFKVEPRVEARHILIKVDSGADDDAVETARKKAEEIYQKAIGGEDFATLAKTYSEGPSKDSGGYLGFFNRDAMVKPFSDKAFSMKPGEISEPVKTEFGWHVIKVESAFDAAVTSFENAKDDIKRSIETEELINLAYYAAGEAYDAIIEGEDLDQAALLADRNVFEAGPFPLQWKSNVVSDSEQFAEAAFAQPVDGLSDVLQLGDAYYIIQTKEKIESKPLEFELVRHQVLSELTASKKQEQARTRAEEVLAQASKNGALAEAATAASLKVNTTPLFTRASKVVEFEKCPGAIQAAFTLSESKPVVSEIIPGEDGYYIVAFKEEKVPADDEIMKNIDTVKRAMVQAKQASAYRSWLEELKNSADIEITEGFLN